MALLNGGMRWCFSVSAVARPSAVVDVLRMCPFHTMLGPLLDFS